MIEAHTFLENKKKMYILFLYCFYFAYGLFPLDIQHYELNFKLVLRY